jgi:hypothetical protein
MTLEEAITTIDTAGDDAVIFARKPWSATADSTIDSLDSALRVPQSLRDAGFEYFLEAAVAKEVCEVFGSRPPSLDEKVRLLLYYAENDAYPEWVYDAPRGGAG